MSYNFLGLLNDVCAKLNETELNSSNFDTSLGVYQSIKDSLNSSIRELNQADFEWPFNHVQQVDTVAAGDTRIPLPVDYKVVDWDSFRVLRDSTLGNKTTKLEPTSYENYQRHYIDNEYNTDTSLRGIPLTVSRTMSDEYILNPTPDQEYKIGYEYFRHQVDLRAYDDVPQVPEAFRYVIVEGAMYHMEMFRADKEAASMHFEKFNQHIRYMKRIYTTRIDKIEDTRVPRGRRSPRFVDID